MNGNLEHLAAAQKHISALLDALKGIAEQEIQSVTEQEIQQAQEEFVASLKAQDEEKSATCANCKAELVLAPILSMLDAAHETDDGLHYEALVSSARLTAHSLMRLVQA